MTWLHNSVIRAASSTFSECVISGVKAKEILISSSGAKERFRQSQDTGFTVPKRDRHESFQQLIDSVNEIGPRNISSLSRRVGLPVETARYKIKRQLPSAGFKVEAEIDYGKLGLSLNWVELDYSERYEINPLEVLHGWSTTNYLAYFSKLFSGNRFVALFTPPLNAREAFARTLDALTEEGLLRTYRADELSFFGYLRPNVAYFDIESKRWLDGWEDPGIWTATTADGLPKMSEPCRIDKTDLSLLRELQMDPTLSARELASRIALPYPPIRYHLVNHVIKRRMVKRFTARWHGGHEETASIVVEFRELTHAELEKTRRTISALPFKFFEAGTGYGRLYITQFVSPKDRLAGILNYLKICLGSIVKKMELKILSNEETKTYPLHIELYLDTAGWQYRCDEILGEIRHSNQPREKS